MGGSWFFLFVKLKEIKIFLWFLWLFFRDKGKMNKWELGVLDYIIKLIKIDK